MSENTRIVLAKLPRGPLTSDDFELDTERTPEPGRGEILVRVEAITIGAGRRAGLQGSASYAGAPTLGALMGGTGVGMVERSRAPEIAEGTRVVAETGWQTHARLPAAAARVITDDRDAAQHLGLLGVNGLTAYFGLLSIGAPSAGETLVVSAAAGSVGHLVGQIAKLKGCRVVGIAGSDEKCRTLIKELDFHAAINRNAEDFRDQFKSATPDRIHIYFDNTGGPILGSALFRMARHGRIVCCGAVSAYDTANPDPSPRGIPGLLVNNRVRMQGFLVFDFEDQYEQARSELGKWADAGDITPWHTDYQGIASTPQAFVDLLAGKTRGTTVVRVSDTL